MRSVRVGVGRVTAARLVLDIVEHLSSELDVVVGELANLGVVDAQNLGILGSSHPQAGDHVHDKQDETGSAEGVEAAGEGVGKLVTHLDPVLIEPSTFDVGDTVEGRDVVGGKEAGADVAD